MVQEDAVHTVTRNSPSGALLLYYSKQLLLLFLLFFDVALDDVLAPVTTWRQLMIPG